MTGHGMAQASLAIAIAAAITASILAWVWICVERIDNFALQGVAVCAPVVVVMWLSAAWAFS